MTSDPFTPSVRETDPLAVLISAERHRAKNTLQVVASLLSLQAREVADPGTRSLFAAAQDRVRVIALFYDRLSRTGAAGRLDFADGLRELVAMVVRNQSGSPVSTQVFAEPLQLDLDTAIPLGLITYELLSDALTHAFVGRATGRVEVSLLVPSTLSECVLTLGDDGIARSPWPPNGGDPLRAKIVDVLLRQLKARLTLESVSGTRLAVRFPLT